MPLDSMGVKPPSPLLARLAKPTPALPPDLPRTHTGQELSVTLEAALWVLVVLASLAVRLWSLDAWPLDAAESRTALAAWSAAQGGRPDLAGLSPLLIYGTALIFLVLPVIDATARLLPVAAGVTLVVLPWFLRRELGRAGALATAAMLALSPSLLFFSRSLDGAILVAAGSLGLLVSVLRLRERRAESWTYAAAVSLAALLLASGAAWATLVSFGAAAAWLVLRSSDRAGWRAALAAMWQRGPILALVGLLVLVSTGLLTNLSGLRWGLIDPPFTWLSGMVSGPATRPWTIHLAALAAYEPLVLFLGLMGCVTALASAIRPRPVTGESRDCGPSGGIAVFLILWLLAGLIWASLSATKAASDVLQPLLPLLLLGGWTTGWLASEIGRRGVLQTGGIGMAWTCILMLLAAAAVLSPASLFGGRFETLEKQLQLLQAGIVLVLFVVLVGVAVWLVGKVGRAGAVMSVGMAIIAVLGAVTVHSAWTLAYEPKDSELLAPLAASRQVRALTSDISALARFSGETLTTVQVEPEAAYPLLWYLRGYRSVLVAQVTAPAKATIVVADAGREKTVQPLMGGYSLRRYRLSTTWQDKIGTEASPWAWLWLRTPLELAQPRDVLMYARATAGAGQ